MQDFHTQARYEASLPETGVDPLSSGQNEIRLHMDARNNLMQEGGRFTREEMGFAVISGTQQFSSW